MLDTAAASCRTKLPSQGHLMAAPINPQNPTPLNDQNDTPGGGNRRGGDYRRWADRTLCRPLLGSLTSRGFTGSGFQPAMIRAQSRACALSVTPGNKRRSSTAADSSPPRSKAARIAAASASVTTNMSTGWVRAPRAASAIMSLKWAGSGPRGHLGGGYGRRWASGGGWADIPGTGWSVMVASCPDLVAWSRSMDASQPLAVARQGGARAGLGVNAGPADGSGLNGRSGRIACCSAAIAYPTPAAARSSRDSTIRVALGIDLIPMTNH